MERNVIFVLLLIVVLVLGINGSLFLLARRKDSFREYKLMGKAFQAARRPWKAEEEDLETLRTLVAALQEPPPEDPA